jgi:hypothetical protein
LFYSSGFFFFFVGLEKKARFSLLMDDDDDFFGGFSDESEEGPEMQSVPKKTEKKKEDIGFYRFCGSKPRFYCYMTDNAELAKMQKRELEYHERYEAYLAEMHAILKDIPRSRLSSPQLHVECEYRHIYSRGSRANLLQRLKDFDQGLCQPIQAFQPLEFAPPHIPNHYNSSLLGLPHHLARLVFSYLHWKELLPLMLLTKYFYNDIVAVLQAKAVETLGPGGSIMAFKVHQELAARPANRYNCNYAEKYCLNMYLNISRADLPTRLVEKMIARYGSVNQCLEAKIRWKLKREEKRKEIRRFDETAPDRMEDVRRKIVEELGFPRCPIDVPKHSQSRLEYQPLVLHFYDWAMLTAFGDFEAGIVGYVSGKNLEGLKRLDQVPPIAGKIIHVLAASDLATEKKGDFYTAQRLMHMLSSFFKLRTDGVYTFFNREKLSSEEAFRKKVLFMLDQMFFHPPEPLEVMSVQSQYHYPARVHVFDLKEDSEVSFYLKKGKDDFTVDDIAHKIGVDRLRLEILSPGNFMIPSYQTMRAICVIHDE